MIILKTNLGNILIELDWENTPNTCENFMKYVEKGFYDNTIFHRVIKDFMIQGGGFDSDMHQKETLEAIQHEAKEGHPQNKRGTVAMARTSDPHSATSQFFINTVDNAFLDFKSADQDGYGYCVFGRVVEGMDIVDQIRAVETASKAGHQDVPVDAIVIESVTASESVAA